MRRFARREWGPLYARVRETLVARKWRAIPLTLASILLISLFQIVQNQFWGYQLVQFIGAVRADDPVLPSLLRTPLSLFVPALNLPVWGALAQVLLVFGIAEICLGRRKTLLIAYVATICGTMYARLGVMLDPRNPLALPDQDGFDLSAYHPFRLQPSEWMVVDTGPSAAVVGLALYVCWRLGARWTAAAVVAAMVAEVIVKPNLAGREHIAALLGVFVLMLVEGAVRGRRRRRAQGLGDGAPPIQS